MNTAIIRPYAAKDEKAVLKLNENSVSFLSPMDKTRFMRIKSVSQLILVAEYDDKVIAFLMGFSDNVDYDSVNYQWFSARFKSFFYIDRIVVDENYRSLGIGRTFYSEIDDWARQQGMKWLVAEIDIEPPNEKSLEFHHRQQFVEVAKQTVGNGKKVVSLQVKSIST
jgi:predicted GNAT superfamily acetyltransferase